MKVRYIPEVADRFLGVLTELAAVNLFAAERFARSVERHYRQLAAFPQSGARVRDFPDLPLRQFIVEPYRFFYSVDARKRTIWIVDIWHGAQIPAEPRLPISV